jgi:hypothetical protein
MFRFSTNLNRLFIVLLTFALPALAQNNNVAVRPYGQQTVAFSATPTFDAAKSNGFKITLTGNVTSSTLTGLEAGMTITLDIYQDNVGSHTFAPPANIAGFVTILSAANAQTTEICYYDGVNCNVYTTTTSGGGGSGTVNTGTAGHYAYYGASGTAVSSNVNLDDGVTNANGLTYAGTAGIFAASYNSNGGGALAYTGTEGACPLGVSGKDIVCIGDSLSHSVQINNNNSGFFPVGLLNSTSPTQHGIMVASTFPKMVAVARGTAGQPLCEGTSSADPGWCQLDLSLSTNVINRLAKANQTASTVYNDQVNTLTTAGTLDASASTVASAFRVPNGAGLTTALNGAIGYDSTANNLHAGINGTDARIPIWTGTAPTAGNCVKWTNVSGHIEQADALTTCGGGSTPRLDQVLSATSGWTTTNGDNPLSLQFAPTTASRTSFELTESSAATSTGTPFLLNVHTLSTSTMNPANFCAQGTSNCWKIDTNAKLSPVGTASLAAPGSTGQLLFNNAGVVAAEDPVVSQAYVNIWTAQDVTTTRTSSAVRNPVFSQTGTLQLTWASITGSPATCTLQMQGVDSQGNALNDGSTFSVSPANGTTSQTFTAAAGLQSAAQVKVIFACVTYPTTGTLTLDFTPIPNVNVTNTVTTTASNLPTTVDTNSGNKSASTLRVVLATDQPQLTNALKVDGSAVTQPVNVTQVGGNNVAADSSGRQLIKQYPDTTTTSYHASKKFAGSSTTDVAVMPGNATNTALVTRIIVSCTQTTAGVVNLELIKRSAADTGGTSAGMTAVPDDSSYAAAVSAPLSYTGTGPTAGTAVGDLDNYQLGCNASATAGPNDIYIFKPAKPIILRGTAQQIAINFGGAITGGNLTITFEWLETTTP